MKLPHLPSLNATPAEPSALHQQLHAELVGRGRSLGQQLIHTGALKPTSGPANPGPAPLPPRPTRTP